MNITIFLGIYIIHGPSSTMTILETSYDFPSKRKMSPWAKIAEVKD